MKKLLSIALALVMVLGLTAIAWAEPVTYMNWNDAEKKLEETTLAEGITLEPVTTATGAVTWDGTTTAKWYIVEGTVTISGRLTVTGAVYLIIKDGCKLTVEKGILIDSGGSLTIYGQANKTGELIAEGVPVTGETTQRSFGIRAKGRLTVNGITVDAAGGDAEGGSVSYGIIVENTVTFNDCAVTAIAGKGMFSNGIYAQTLIVNGGAVDATGDEASHSSSGIYVDTAFTINGGRVTATGGKVTNANTDYGSFGVGNKKATLTSGTLIAKGDTASADGVTVKAMRNAPDLPASYWWRTAETGDFTKFADDTTAYVNGTNTYAEITTTQPVVTPPADEPEPEPEPEPDQEPSAPAHEPIRRQHTTAVEDTTDTADTTKADDTAKTDTVTSAQTFDAGVAVYGAMAALSLTGTAWVARKKF